jgi:sporulation protein YlmC with PRC-barrel domain
MMKQLFVTACAVTALCGTALAQAPKDSGTAGTQPQAAQPAKPSKPATAQSANPGQSNADQSKSGSPPQSRNQSKVAPSGNTGGQSQPNKANAKADASKPSTAPSAAATKPQGTVSVTFYTVKPADVRASKLIGSTVYNVNNESIGDIEDVVLDEGKTLRAVVIGVGGFLGMGERHVAVDPQALVITRNSDKDDMQIVLNTTKNDLKNAPEVKFDKESRQKAATTEAPKPEASKAGAPGADASKRGAASKSAGTTGAGDNDKAPAKPDEAGKAPAPQPSQGGGAKK